MLFEGNETLNSHRRRFGPGFAGDEKITDYGGEM